MQGVQNKLEKRDLESDNIFLNNQLSVQTPSTDI